MMWRYQQKTPEELVRWTIVHPWIYMLKMDVSENSGTPKSPILIGISIVNRLFWGTPIFGNTHMEHFPRVFWKNTHLFFFFARNMKKHPNQIFSRKKKHVRHVLTGFPPGSFPWICFKKQSPKWWCKMVMNPMGSQSVNSHQQNSHPRFPLKKQVPGTPSVLFFEATLPLKPATIALKIGHLAFQVVLLFPEKKTHLSSWASTFFKRSIAMSNISCVWQHLPAMTPEVF